MLKLKLMALFCLLISSTAFANPIGMPTGSTGGTYYPMGLDIAKLSAKNGVQVQVKNSLGSLDNIRRMASTENAGLSLVQSDVIEFLNSQPTRINRSVLKNLRLVFPLYNEEVHLLAKSGINTVADLANKRVAVGKIGSGTFVTSSNILNKLGINVIQLPDLSPKDAYQGLLLGKVDAVFFVGGKPISYINGLLEMKLDEALSKYAKDIHLVPLDDPRLYDSYAKASIAPNDYKSSDGTASLTNVEVPTVAVKAVMVSYNFSKDKTSSYYRLRCDQVDQINTIVRENLPLLRAGGTDGTQYHPKWADVDLDQPVDLAKSACIKGIGGDVDEAKEIACYLQTGSRCE
jgi:TRAP transporter TAXI family solute receptor